MYFRIDSPYAYRILIGDPKRPSIPSPNSYSMFHLMKSPIKYSGFSILIG